jgi:aspartate carbamoyltransferase catalytic subunit
MRHFLSTQDLDLQQVELLFRAARNFRGLVESNQNLSLLSGKTVVHLFYENSTRTRLSFDQAVRRLGGATVAFATGGSSVSKGETLVDTAQNILAMKPHALVIRHSCAGSPQFLSRVVSVPVVNAGDGLHEHPTQALLDAFTIHEKLGGVRGKRILIIGDIAHSRVARSNIILLKKLGAEVAVCGPPTLMPPRIESLGVEYGYRPEALLPEADVVMCLRIQLERQNRMQIPSIAEYSQFWGIQKEREKLMKPTAILMHPGPVNRGVEIDPEVADGNRSVILDQVTNGILVRMAVLAQLLAPEALNKWLSEKGSERSSDAK